MTVLCRGANSPVPLLETVEQAPISFVATLLTLCTKLVGSLSFPVTLARCALYLVASRGDARSLGRTVIRPHLLPAGTSPPFPCLVKFVSTSPLTTFVCAVAAFNFPCLVLLGALLPFVSLTVESNALLANVPGGRAQCLETLVVGPLKARFLVSGGKIVLGLVLLLRLLDVVWDSSLTLC